MPIDAPFQYLTKEQVTELLGFVISDPTIDKWLDNTVSDENKDKSIYAVSALFDGLSWNGFKVWEGQDHAFPREFNVYDSLNSKRYINRIKEGNLDNVDDLPKEVAIGFSITCCYLVDDLINDTQSDNVTNQGFSKIKIGTIEVDVKEGVSTLDYEYLPDKAQRWLEPFMSASKTGKGIHTFRFIS